MQDFLHAKRLDEGSHDEIHQSGTSYTQTGIVQCQSLRESLCDTHLLHRGIAPKEGKRRPQEGRYVPLRDEMEYQGSYACKQQRNRHVQTCQQWHEHRCSKHGKQVLHAQYHHAGQSQLACVENSILRFHIFFLFSYRRFHLQKYEEKKKKRPLF